MRYREQLVLTDKNTNKFICIVNKTPKRFINDLKVYGTLDTLANIHKPVQEIDYHEGYHVGLEKEPSKSHEWNIHITGDNGIITLKLTKHFTTWA